MTGEWVVTSLSEFDTRGDTPLVGLIRPDGTSLCIDYSFSSFDDGITPFNADALRAFTEPSNALEPFGSWFAQYARYDEPGMAMPEVGTNYELAISWCPTCTNGITCTISFADVLVSSMTISNPCEPFDDTSLDFDYVGIEIPSFGGDGDGPLLYSNVTGFDISCGTLAQSVNVQAFDYTFPT